MIEISAVGPITELTLDRPEKRNALSVALLEALLAALSSAAARPDTRVVILRGAGPVFCAGLDLAEASATADSHPSAALIADVLETLHSSRLVTIAAVHGAALAGGAGVMAACDFVVAAEGTKIGFPEVRRGLVAALVMTLLRRQVGDRTARELLLGAEPIDAARAREIGLVNRVCPAADVLAHARHVAAEVLQGAPGAIADTKRLLDRLWPRPLRDELDRALAFHLQARGSPEAQEGMAAFREKRPPRWTPPPSPG